MAVCGADWLLKNGDLVPDRSPHSSTADVKSLDSELAGLSLADKPGDGGSDGSSDRDSTSASGGEEDADPKKDPTAHRRRKRGKPKGKTAAPPQYPLLPGEPACAYFLKTGTCRFGANCKFHHQRRWKKNRVSSTKQSVKPNDAVETSHVKPKNALELSQMKPKDAVEPSQAAKEEKKTLPESVECMQCKDVIKEKEKEKEKETLPEKVVLIESKKVEKDKEKETNTERADQAKCKFYLTPLGCKFGKDCKFLHDVDKIDVGPTELNFLGLPIRRGEKNCPYYMRTGGCKYATKCRYHHPDPIAVGRQDPHSTYQTSGSAQLHVSGTPPLPSASWPLQISNETVPFYDSSTSYATGVFLPPQAQYPNPQWNGYQAPVYPWYATDISIRHPSALPIDDATRNIDGFVHQKPEFDEYPERPGQKECQYFMKTGDCKFKSACRFHHPKSRLSKASAAT